MNYSTKNRTELQALRNRFMTALTSDRLNATNRVSIEGWISQIEAALVAKATPVKIAKPVSPKAPSVRGMRDGSEGPRNAADQDRLAWSFMS